MNVLRTGLLFIALLFLPIVVLSQNPERIVGIGIACSNDRVYVWYEDGTLSVGTSANLGAYQPYLPGHTTYTLPPGKTPLDIVGISIASDDHVYAWYRDGTASSGTSSDLDKYRLPYSYSLAPGKSPGDVAGIGIACSNDHVYAWYKDGTVSSGKSSDLDQYRTPYTYTLPPGKGAAHLVGIDIAGNDHVYAWYLDRTASSGTSANLIEYDAPYTYVFASPACDIYANPPVHGLETGYGISGIGGRGPSCESIAPLTVALKEDVPFWFDRTLARAEGGNFEGGNQALRVEHRCRGNRSQMVYLEVTSQGRKKQSTRVPVSCD